MADEKKVKEPSKIGAKFKSLKSELKKITWSSIPATFKNFALVLVCIVAMAAVIGLIDWGLESLFAAFIA